MIDIKILRDDPERVAANCARRGHDVDVMALHAKDKEYRELLQKVEAMQADRNRLSKECRDNPEAREQVKAIKVDLAAADERAKELKAEVDEGLSWLPNFLADDVPDGDGDEGNVEIRTWGEKQDYGFEPRDHQELGEILGIIDTARGAKVAQSGFYYWKGAGAQLASALFSTHLRACCGSEELFDAHVLRA